MINYDDQMNLFTLIASRLSKDIVSYAFGGNAMMFYGYEDETKDVDLVFPSEEDRAEFIRVIEELGFEETSPIRIYELKKLRDKSKPIMFKKEDTRFDLFVEKIFRTQLSEKMKEDLFAVHEFKDKHNLRVNVLRKEHIVLLKAITDRKADFDDIRTILDKEKNFNWQYLIDEVIWQYKNGDSCIILDIEKMLKELKEYVFVENKYLKQLYDAQE